MLLKNTKTENIRMKHIFESARRFNNVHLLRLPQEKPIEMSNVIQNTI